MISSSFAKILGVDLDPTQAADLADKIATAIRNARQSWPGIGTRDDAFVIHLARRVGPTLEESSASELGFALETIAVSDLYLAWACLERDEVALSHFDRFLRTEVDAACARFPNLPLEASDVHQRVLDRLFLRDEPAMARYGGQGSLRNWLRVMVLRILMNVHVREGRAVPVDDALFDALAQPGGETLHLHEEYRAAFRDAFGAAIEQLSNRQKSLLRYSLSDGLSIDEIGIIYRVHRATAARWITQAREKLVQATHAELLGRLHFTEGDLASIMRAALSQVDTSIAAYFRSDAKR